MVVDMEAFYGREQELEQIELVIERISEGGTALLVRGEAGIGKSALLRQVERSAAQRRIEVVRAAGVQSETHLAFAGLHFMLRPAIAHLDRLPDPQRAALSAAFGLSNEVAPDIFLIALAVLELLAELAAESPLLVIVEDAHWLDAASSDVLAFVARRIELEPVVMVFAVRDGADSRFDELGLPELRLARLADDDAGALLDAVAPDLSASVRDRLLDDAAGNPLALIELPRAIRDSDRVGWLPPEPLRLTARLESAFAARIQELPPETRTLLLVAALHDRHDMDEITAVARAIEPECRREVFASAAAAGLVQLEGASVEFRHPLMRSAVNQAASLEERRRAHAALAAALAREPDRRVWHEAAAADAPDEAVARELEAAAERALRRGSVPAALEALERAARLTPVDETRGSRLIRAGRLGLDLGRVEYAIGLLREAEPLPLAPRQRTQLLWLLEATDQRWSGVSRVPVVVELAKDLAQQGEIELALQALADVALRCWGGNPGDETRALVAEAAESFGLPPDTPSLLNVLALADPVRHGAAVLERLSRLSPAAFGNPNDLLELGLAATAVWAEELAEDFVSAAVGGLRGQGRLGLLPHALVVHAWMAVHIGLWDAASTSAVEATSLAHETRQPRWEVTARLAEAAVEASRGNVDRADLITSSCERALLASGATPLLAEVQFVRGRSRIAEGRHGDAYDELRRVFDPGDAAYHPLAAVWTIVDLAEAAAHAGHREEAGELLAPLEAISARSGGQLLQASIRFARAVLADEAQAEKRFGIALAGPTGSYPFIRARLQLAHGSRLRRDRQLAASRLPLRAARDTFDGLGAAPWADRAREELRASGESARPRRVDLRRELTPQELQIARMAAEGLTNREIGERLYLSHRTVGVHLYRIFPKLGVSSRGHLRAALELSSAPST
jgi:DNA-binding CsgD family transcriptional regulator